MNYQYSVTNDTLNGIVDETRLWNELVFSGISVALQSMTIDDETINVTYLEAISAPEKLVLDNLIAAHTGEPLPGEIQKVSLEKQDVTGTPIITIDKPAGNFSTIITHDLCNNTTWSSQSNSTWELVPSAGEVLSVVKAEVQVQHDVSVAPGEIYLNYYAWVGGGATAIVETITFASMYDIFNLGNSHYHSPSFPEITGGLSTIIFDYVNKLRFHGDETPGSLYKISISTKNHAEITGSFATVGFVTRLEMA